MKKLLAILLALSMCFALLTGCGSSSDAAEQPAEEPAAEEPAAEEPAEEPAEDAEAADGDAAALTTVTEGVLTMSTNAAFPPYEMTTDDGGRMLCAYG